MEKEYRKNLIGTSVVPEHIYEKRFLEITSTMNYLARLYVDRESRGMKVYLEFGNHKWKIDEFAIVLSSPTLGILELKRIDELEDIELLDLVIPDEVTALLKIKKAGKEEQFLSSFSRDPNSFQFSLYLGCESEAIVAWIAKMLPQQVRHFITIHKDTLVHSERELQRFADIAFETINRK